MCVYAVVAWSGDAKQWMTLAGGSCPLGELVIGHTHTHHYALFSCNLPLCGVTSRSRVFCDKLGQIAIISFLSSASIWCLSAPPGQPHDPECPHTHTRQTFVHTCIHSYICKHPTHINTVQRYRPKGRPKEIYLAIHACTHSPETKK